jgi:hypothetical protein
MCPIITPMINVAGIVNDNKCPVNMKQRWQTVYAVVSLTSINGSNIIRMVLEMSVVSYLGNQ